MPFWPPRSFGSGRQPRVTLPPWQLLARAPVFAAVGTYIGTVLTERAWADCPLGVSASNGIGLVMGTMPVVWVVMTAAMLLIQLSVWAVALPVPAVRCVQWLLPVAAVVLFTAVYRTGMQSPVVQPDGTCYEGYPVWPFQPKYQP
ncbi:hypothetical protein [Streptomyces sp. NRRL F-5123]|uniref:hypothetical protein n=1 Tax=Streptomyces sp. NRRL F-5123 TaxID=1463856 RepID=UPI00131BA4D0|nr:hypothetical protein [Streptomyces sp. NRRL F-5123]